MDFLAAVQALKDGECEGIEREGWERVGMLKVNKLGELQDRFGSGLDCRSPILEVLTADDWQLVNPLPQTEKREVKRWIVMDSIDKPSCVFHETQESAEKARKLRSGYSTQEITITVTVPIPPKVKRREVMGTFYSGYDAFRAKGDKGIPDDAELIFEWEE